MNKHHDEWEPLDSRESSQHIEQVAMRNTRVLYVEDDPALRTIMTEILNRQSGIEIVSSVSNATEALVSNDSTPCDVALIDLALGTDSANGFELALKLRHIDHNIGIVIYSQHASENLQSQIPHDERFGWSIVQKKAPVDVKTLVNVLKATARGTSHVEPYSRSNSASKDAESILQLTKRQHVIMSMLIEGIDVAFVAEKLNLSQVTIRQELSRIYKVLVPDPQPETDLRTTAVLKYLRYSRKNTWAHDN